MKRIITGAAILSLALTFASPATSSEGAASVAKQIASLQKKIIALEERIDAMSDEIGFMSGENVRVTNQLDVLLANKPEDRTKAIKAVLAKVEPSMYQISCYGRLGSGFGLSVTWGTSLTADGYSGAVVTNHHVVASCLGDRVTVTQNGRNLGGMVVNWDEDNDLALIATLGNTVSIPISTVAPQRGDTAIALGSPFGLEGSISVGVVSNFTLDDVVSDAAIDPGNSGGPLVNLSGELIGINAWGWEGSQGSSHSIKPGVLCRQILICSTNEDLLAWSK